MNIIKKISVATVNGTIDKKALYDPAAAESGLPIMRVMGVANGVEAGTSSMGDWECLVGDFKAINSKGEEFYSGKAFLPGAGHSVIAGKLNGTGQGVEFVLDFAARADRPQDKKSATGYTYIVKPVIEQAADSAILRLENKIAEMAAKAEATKNAETGQHKGKK